MCENDLQWRTFKNKQPNKKLKLHSPKLTAKAPENRPKRPKRKPIVFQPSIFRCKLANCLGCLFHFPILPLSVPQSSERSTRPPNGRLHRRWRRCPLWLRRWRIRPRKGKQRVERETHMRRMGLVYIYLHEWPKFMVNVGTYSIHAYGAFGIWCVVYTGIICTSPWNNQIIRLKFLLSHLCSRWCVYINTYVDSEKIGWFLKVQGLRTTV